MALDPQPGETSRFRYLVRVALGLLVLLATAVGAASWERLRQFAGHFELIPLLLVAVVCVFVFLVYSKTREMSELRSTVVGLQGQQQVLTSEMETQKLLQVMIASREAFRGLIDSVEAAVFTVSLDGKIRAVNRAVIEILGVTFQDVIGNDLTNYISSPTAERMKSGMEEFLKKRHWSGNVKVRLAKTGQWRYFDCTVQPVLQDDVVLAMTIIAADVTAEREREKSFSTLFETLQEAVWIASGEGKLLDGNAAMVMLLGSTNRDQMLGVNVLERIEGSQRGVVERALENRETIRDVELSVRREDGNSAVCLASATAVYGISGEIRYHGTFTDVTARRATERMLAQEQNFRERLVASFPDAIACTDEDGRFTFASGQAEKMFGRRAAALAKMKIGELVEADEAAKIELAMKQAWTKPEDVIRTELQLRGGDIVQASVSAISDGQQTPSGMVWSLRDVTEQRRMQEELVASERLVAVGQMLEGFSHELNNPLTTIVGACELLKDEAMSDSAQRNLELLRTQSVRARELVRNLLLFAAPTTEGRASVNIVDLLKAVIALRGHSISAKNINLDFRDPGVLPFTTGEPAQLMQMFLNVLVNAEQASAGSSDGGTIRIRVGSDQNWIWCTVQDDGPGIGPEEAKRMFEPFFTTGRSERKVGLGLSISRSIAKAHGGSIEYSAAADGGSVLKIVLPAGSRSRTNSTPSR